MPEGIPVPKSAQRTHGQALWSTPTYMWGVWHGLYEGKSVSLGEWGMIGE